MEQIFKKFEQRGLNWFNMTDELKDDILADLAHEYITWKKNKSPKINLQEIASNLSQDIDKVKQQDRFELASMLKQILDGLLELIQEMNNQNKQ